VLSPARVRRTRIILLAEIAVAVVLALVLHPFFLVALLLPVAELLTKPSDQRAQILGLKS